MKQIIMDVLDDMSMGQINLGSEGARKVIANTITAALKTKGSYKEYTDYELDEQKARASWVCSICGKNTFEVDSDYIGSGTNHLGCEIRLEQDENYRKKNWSQKKHEDKVFGEYAEDIDEQAYAQGRGSSHHIGPDGHYEKDLYEDVGDGTLLKVKDDEVYHIIKHLGYDTKDKKQTVVGKISESQLNNLYPWHEEEQKY